VAGERDRQFGEVWSREDRRVFADQLLVIGDTGAECRAGRVS
jgi:hypothetical protein